MTIWTSDELNKMGTAEELQIASLVEEIDNDINDRIGAAYNKKYDRYASITTHMTSSGPRSATIKLVLRATGT